jgi:hypothetical protein
MPFVCKRHSLFPTFLELPGQQERPAEARVQFGGLRLEAQGHAIALLRFGRTAEIIEYVPRPW